MTESAILALHSVMFRSLFGEPAGGPAELMPLPLTDCAQVLVSTTGTAPEKKWWALSYLLASPLRDTAGLSNPLNRAIVDLAPSLEPALPSAPVFSALHAPSPGGSIRIDHDATFRFLEEHLGPQPSSCQKAGMKTECRLDEQTGANHGKATLRVRRPLAAVARTMDPQNWRALVPDYFEASCVTDCRDGCAPDEDHDLPCVAQPPTVGSAWSEHLFESYLYIAGMGYEVAFKNVLAVKSVPAGGSHRYEYALDRNVFSRIGYQEKMDGGIDLDGGYFQLSEAADGWVDVTVTKDFRLAGWDLGASGPYTRLLNEWSNVAVRATVASCWDVICTDL